MPNLVPANTPNDGLPNNFTPVEEPPIMADSAVVVRGAPRANPPGPDGNFSGSIPLPMQLTPDIMPVRYPGGIGGYRIMPPILAGVPGVNAAIKSAVPKAIPGPPGAAGAAGAAGSGSDGLIHGDSIWEIDDAVFRLRDDFSGFGAPGTSNGIVSDLYWALFGSSGQQSQGAPNLGGINFVGTNASSTVSLLVQGIQHLWVSTMSAAWPLLDNPPWKMVWEFQINRPYSFTNVTTPPVFSWSQVSFYLGLGNYPAFGGATSATSVRPPYFIGLRYDTDPTSPAISDTDFVFEAVSNITDLNTRAALNPQGNVVHTGITASEGTNYRLEMTCTAAGSVTLTLFNGTTSFSTTLVMPQFTVTGANELMAQNGVGIINPSVLHMPCGPGTNLLISGASGGAAIFNGTQICVGGLDTNTFANILLGGTLAFGTYSSTIACYPALFPYCGFGTDSTSSPVANSKAITIDFFSFVWNPAVGGGTGTPNPIKARYW